MSLQPPRHFGWNVADRVATITLDRPERKNPLTFDSYAELRDMFRALALESTVKAVVITGAGGNFCSGGDIFDVVKAMRLCPQPIIAAVEGVCAGAGAILAMAADLRYGTADSRTAFLFTRVGLAGCDMGACAILPRIIGQGRAAELLYTGRAMTGEEAERWGFFNALHPTGQVLTAAQAMAMQLVDGPTFAHGITKTMLHREWSMDIEGAIEAEAQAQAICMATEDFRRAFEAFAAKRRPNFRGD
jgi:enoyl-CoA hydratase/carnithine racemase